MTNIGERLMRCVLFLVGLIGLLATDASAVVETVQGRIKIMQPWVHETSGTQAILRVTIANTGAKADRLVRVSTPVADKVLILDQQSNEGSGLLIPGRSELVMGVIDLPRIELVGLTKSLKASDTFHLLLVFKQAGKVIVNVLVEK
jgi:copper(I)-binding protein